MFLKNINIYLIEIENNLTFFLFWVCRKILKTVRTQDQIKLECFFF